jgi:superfamily II DNA or RNA helicase
MGRSIRLRPWQRRALDAYLGCERPDFLAVATPGAGKTTFALTAARLTLPHVGGRLVVVAPTRHLKEQWGEAAARLDLDLETEWNPSDGLPADVHGVVTTYQQVGGNPEAFVALSRGGVVILDEIHHAGDERSWGTGVQRAFAGAARRLALSGTPFRSDLAAIPFVRYESLQVVPDVEYGYGDALADGRVVRPVYFPRFGGHMEWMAPDGSEVAASFDDPLTRTLTNQRLRAALSLDGEWLPAVLSQAHDQLQRIRQRHAEAGGLVIAVDQQHAHGIAELLRRRFGVVPAVAVSDDPGASAAIARFAAGDNPWIVAVRMVSEGVDIPRLRVGVFATTTTTELFFRQAVGRIVRWMPGAGRQRAYLFLPDDARLRYWAGAIAEARRHKLWRSDADDDDAERPGEEPHGTAPAERDGEQLSLFTVLSATASDLPELADVLTDTEEADDEAGHTVDDPDDEALVLDLAALPSTGVRALGPTRERRRRRLALRHRNAELAKDLASLTGRSHAQVNAELNRRAGLKRISEATVDQLDRRARAADEWLERERRRVRMGRFTVR